MQQILKIELSCRRELITIKKPMCLLTLLTKSVISDIFQVNCNGVSDKLLFYVHVSDSSGQNFELLDFWQNLVSS